MPHLKISAVIPAYNSATFLPSAVNSIIKQTRPVDEIIVVDDGSTDETQNVCRLFDQKVTCVFQNNTGPSAARNKGIVQAKGDWIAFLDADDQWVTKKIEKQMQAIEKDPNLALVAGDMAEINTRMELLVPSVVQKHGMTSFFIKHQDKALPNAMDVLLKKNFIPTGTVMVKKKVLTTIGAFNPSIRYGEDLELWAKIAATHSIAFIPEVLMFRTRHESNATSATENMLKDLVQVMLSLKQWVKSNNIDADVDLDYYVSRAWADLGYFNFTSNCLQRSKQYFLNSYTAMPSYKAFVYYWVSFLSPKLIKDIKKNISLVNCCLEAFVK